MSTLFGPELVGIINVTPDSFSDGGKFLSATAAIEQARSLWKAGASVIDIGAESTRPRAIRLAGEDPPAIHPREEWARLEPALLGISEWIRGERLPLRLSLDSRNAETVQRALEFGVDWINDVTGLDHPKMQEIAAAADRPVVVMHHLGVPPSRDRVIAADSDPIEELNRWWERKVQTLGLRPQQLIFDPGIGFGKSFAQNFQIIREVSRLQARGARILIGHSRKSFLSLVTSRPAAERDLETHALSVYLARQGVDYLRVHDCEGSLRVIQPELAIEGISLESAFLHTGHSIA